MNNNDNMEFNKQSFNEIIEGNAVSQLSTLHLLIFGKSSSSNLIKKNLRTFNGFTSQDIKTTYDRIVSNFNQIELVEVCDVLRIGHQPDEILSKEMLAEDISRRLCVLSPEAATEADDVHSVSSTKSVKARLHEEI